MMYSAALFVEAAMFARLSDQSGTIFCADIGAKGR